MRPSEIFHRCHWYRPYINIFSLLNIYYRCEKAFWYIIYFSNQEGEVVYFVSMQPRLRSGAWVCHAKRRFIDRTLHPHACVGRIQQPLAFDVHGCLIWWRIQRTWWKLPRRITWTSTANANDENPELFGTTIVPKRNPFPIEGTGLVDWWDTALPSWKTGIAKRCR